MDDHPKDPRELVLTEGDPAPPPAEPVPSPEHHPNPADNCENAADVVQEVRALADQVGGLTKLRELVDSMMSVRR